MVKLKFYLKSFSDGGEVGDNYYCSNPMENWENPDDALGSIKKWMPSWLSKEAKKEWEDSFSSLIQNGGTEVCLGFFQWGDQFVGQEGYVLGTYQKG